MKGSMELKNELFKIDGKGYKAYKALVGRYDFKNVSHHAGRGASPAGGQARRGQNHAGGGLLQGTAAGLPPDAVYPGRDAHRRHRLYRI